VKISTRRPKNLLPIVPSKPTASHAQCQRAYRRGHRATRPARAWRSQMGCDTEPEQAAEDAGDQTSSRFLYGPRRDEASHCAGTCSATATALGRIDQRPSRPVCQAVPARSSTRSSGRQSRGPRERLKRRPRGPPGDPHSEEPALARSAGKDDQDRDLRLEDDQTSTIGPPRACPA